MITRATRRSLRRLEKPETTNPGLWFDRFLTSYGDADARRFHLTQAANLCAASAESTEYRLALTRWIEGFDAQDQSFQDEQAESQDQRIRPLVLTWQTASRLAIGTGAASTLEVSVSLHPVYGVPVIPAAAFKGLVQRYVTQRAISSETNGPWCPSPTLKWSQRLELENYGFTAHDYLFGHPSLGGACEIHDSLLLPSGTPPLALDTITVHHRDYYQGRAAPSDADAPVPVQYLSVPAGAQFVTIVMCPSVWLPAFVQVMRAAVENEGVGAKTSSGYGRMVLLGEPMSPSEALRPMVLRRVLEGAPTEGKWKWVVETKLPSIPESDRRQAARAILSLHNKMVDEWRSGSKSKQRMATALEDWAR